MKQTEDILTSLREFSDDDLPLFTDCIRNAFASVSPVFTRPRYGEFFFHCAANVPSWLSRVVMANADAESQGSEKLFQLWRGASANAKISKDVLIHAKDESRHSRLFISLIEDSFPGSFSTASLQAKRTNLFRITPESLKQRRFDMPDEELMDHLIQMNMGEIRTRAHMLLLSPVIYALTPAHTKNRVRPILEGLVTDEVRHINYTAHFIESWCQNGDEERIRELYERRLRDFHRLTIEQTEASVRAYGAGRYPDLLEI